VIGIRYTVLKSLSTDTNIYIYIYIYIYYWFLNVLLLFIGVMPDGVFDRNTKIFYCCRMDGNPGDPIFLPSSEPFFLMKIGGVCQQV